MSAIDYVDAVHNFLLSQKLTTLLGNFPEVLQVSDILEYKGACSDRGVIILLVFLSSQLIMKRNVQQINFHKLLGYNQNSERKSISIRRDRLHGNHDGTLNTEEICQNGNEDNERNFKAIMAWWKEMAEHNSKANVKLGYAALPSFTGKQSSDNQREKAAKIIQSHFRRLVEYRNYTRMKKAVSILQALIRAWLMVKNTSAITKFNMIKNQESLYDKRKLSERFWRYLVDRHAFIKLTRSVVIIQHAIRDGVALRHQNDIEERAWAVCQKNKTNNFQVKAALRIQVAWRKHVNNSINQQSAATTIQTCYLSWLLRKSFLNQKQAATKIQTHYHGWRSRRSFLNQKQAAMKIQSHYRGSLSRKSFLKMKQAVIKLQSLYRFLKCFRNFKHYKLEIKSAVTIQSHARGWIARRVACRKRLFIVLIQSFCRGWLRRREFLLQKEAATRIQSVFRCFKCLKAFNCYMHAAVVIQRYVRGCVTRKKLLGASCLQEGARAGCNYEASKDCFNSHELEMSACSVSKLQRWWRGILLAKARRRSAIVIQSHVRGWIARRTTAQRRHHIALIQSYWKGYIERKHSRGKLPDLRLRVQKSAANVDDGMRIINRLIAALSELKNVKSVSGILHICATLDMATKHSQKCCEQLVAAGAIDTLLGVIRSISRSIPDQEVLRHTLSTFRNLTRHPHLTEALIDTRGSGEAILWEFIRNKEDAYFIAADLLRNICSNKKGVKRLRDLHALVKRLHNLVEDLKRKAGNEKRNLRTLAVKEQTDRRLKEAVEILKLITNG